MSSSQFVRQNWIARLVQKLRSAHEPTRSARTHRLLGMETLEGRTLLAGIVNGDFQSDAVTHNGGAYQFYETVQGWTRSSGTHVELQRGIFNGVGPDDKYVELDSNGPSSIRQEVFTEIGQAYKLRFSFSGRPNTAAIDNILRVGVFNTDGGETALPFTLLDSAGRRVSDNLPQLPGNSNWQNYEAIIVAASTKTTIEFGDAGTTANGLGTLLDNVSFEETTETPPPANLIVNGGFERHIVTDNGNTWHLYPEVAGEEIPGWELEEGDQIELERGILGGPAEGYQHLELDSHPLPGATSVSRTAVSQTINTIAGHTYHL